MLRVAHISKSFAGVKALQDVSMSFELGEVHALCGENGAGKSTLMNIIVGNLLPDEGVLYWHEEPLQLSNVHEANKKGIAIVYQEKSLIDSLSIAENIYLQNAPITSWGLIDYRSLYQQTDKLLQQLGLKDLSARTLVERLSSAQKSMVEIAKALVTEPSLLILDEPTASLTHHETEVLFDIIRDLKQKNVAIIYITHRMKEVREIADKISVLKDGQYQGTFPAKNISPDQLIRLMVGRELQQIQFESHLQKEPVLHVQNISGKGFHNISFTLHKGEILGFAGLEGSGRTAMARALFGDVEIIEGKIEKTNKTLSVKHPAEAIEEGIAYLPDDRKGAGLFLEKTISENIIAAQLKKGYYHQANHDQISRQYSQQLAIKMTSVRQLVRNLSGGNQQKVVLAKWLSIQPDVLIVNEPTHGVDVGAKAEIYQLLKKMTSEGKGIILISSDLPELLLLSDRIVVMYNGEIQDILNRDVATEERITALASGIKKIA